MIILIDVEKAFSKIQYFRVKKISTLQISFLT